MSQTLAIHKHLASGKEITPIQALTRYQCMRLAGRINDLRDMGIPISTRIIKKNGKRYASYKLDDV
jgi:hypothetical protein